MAHDLKKPSFSVSTGRDYMIARHSRPSHSPRRDIASPTPTTQSSHSPQNLSNSTQEPNIHDPIITATSRLEMMLTPEGEGESVVNLHEFQHVTRLSHAMEEMKRLDLEFVGGSDNTDGGGVKIGSEAHREILLQEMLPEFLSMREVWRQEWNILRRRKAEMLRDRWERGVFSEKERAVFEITDEQVRTAERARRRNARRFVLGAAGYAILVIGVVVGLAWLGMNYDKVVAVVEKMEEIDFFLGE